jgi:hypothetical protein
MARIVAKRLTRARPASVVNDDPEHARVGIGASHSTNDVVLLPF